MVEEISLQGKATLTNTQICYRIINPYKLACRVDSVFTIMRQEMLNLATRQHEEAVPYLKIICASESLKRS